MTYGTPEQYRRWFEYERDSHAKVLAALNAVPEDKRGNEPFKKAVTLMAHLVEARKLWLYRFGVTSNNHGTRRNTVSSGRWSDATASSSTRTSTTFHRSAGRHIT